MGPEGGNRGGFVVAEGTPEQVAAAADSFTGQFLAPLLVGTDVQVAKPPRTKDVTAATSAPANKTVKKTAVKKTAAKKPAKKTAATKTAKKAAAGPAEKKPAKKTAAATKRAPRKTRRLSD
jgi:excinuclease ABC subunit A